MAELRSDEASQSGPVRPSLVNLFTATSADRLLFWAERWAHFTPVEHLKGIVELAMQQPHIEKADVLAELLARGAHPPEDHNHWRK